MPDYYDDVLTYDFPTFIGKSLSAIDPSAQFLPNWHIDLIAEYLEAARKSQITRLIINMPPRSLKSVCVSVAWPAWILGHDPKSRIIAASYAASLSIKHSLDCRLLINNPWYKQVFPDVKLSLEQNEKHKFMTTKRGFRMSSSVGASVVGEGGNFLIIDDPISPAQAMNKNWRSHVNNWFDHTFSTRLNNKKLGVIVLVMQRLHSEDLSGYLLAKGGWEHLSLPAVSISPQTYSFGKLMKVYEAGELLHPERENLRLIERAKIELGSSAFAAQYQQNPQPDEGGMVKRSWLTRYTTLPTIVESVVQSWDTAIKSGAQHDASVCLTFIESGGRSYLSDSRVMRLEYPDLKRVFYAHSEEHKPNVILLEDKASGQQLLQDVRRESHLPLLGIRPKSDKVTRFAAVSAMIEAGKLVLPQQAPWLADFESELLSFPNGANDDQVDALTQYLDWKRSKAWEKLSIRKL
ncbi:MAG: phage terminase large subunit [Rickettsiales bacterium]|jgi:predicted phage terminase large subunit-like protein